MAKYRISRSRLQGTLTIPASKSHTLRSILFAALAHGSSRIESFLPSPDTNAMIEAVRLLGAKVEIQGESLTIQGFGDKFNVAEDVIQCGNSGQVLRFIGAIAALLPNYTILTGDHSIRHNRPVQPLLDALTKLGATALSSRGDGYAPILIKGPITGRSTTLDGQDSQPVSGLLIAAAFAPHPIEIYVTNPGEKPWIDLTLYWLRRLKIPYHAQNYTHYQMQGNAKIDPFEYRVPGDFSTAAFAIAAALLTQSELLLTNIDMSDIQGDKQIILILEQMGAHFEIDAKQKTLRVLKTAGLRGIRIDVNDFIDTLPILAVIATFAQGTTEITGAAIARKKESDRIHTITQELKKMGANIEERADGVIVQSSNLHSATLHTYHDHRLVLSLSVAALAAEGESTILGVEAAMKTYPNFYQDFLSIGANIQQMEN